MLSFAREKLFEPLGFVGWEWWNRDRAGRYPGGYGLRIRPMDAAKLGQLYLQRGRWNARAIITPAFIDEVWKPGPSPRYGRFWWRLPLRPEGPFDMFVAQGWKGQRVFVVPKNRVVVVTTAHMDDQLPVLHAAIRKMIAAAGDRPVAASESGREALRREMTTPFAGSIAGPHPLPDDAPRKRDALRSSAWVAAKRQPIDGTLRRPAPALLRKGALYTTLAL